MATEDEGDSLKLYWDHFFKSETGTYEKSTWLDLFLAEFLIRIKDGANPKELIKFCPVSGVVTLVGCELLCGIHRVTSSINTHYTPPLQTLSTPDKSPDTEEKIANGDKSDEVRVESRSVFARANALPSSEILRKYLLGGVAWRCLVLLRALGVEGLSCCRQLSSVLIWLYGELSGIPAASGSQTITAVTSPTAQRTPIHQLFSQRIWSKYKTNTQVPKANSIADSDKGPLGGRSRLSSQYESPDKPKRKVVSSSDESSGTGDSCDDLQALNRSLAVKVCTPNDDFEYFNSSLRSSNEYPDTYTDSYYSPKKSKPKADDYMNEQHKEIINSEISDFEFTLILTDLLQELCKTESSLSGCEGSQISMQCINFSLRNLCSLQFSSVPAHNDQQVSRIKVALTELLIVSLDKVLVHSDLCAKLINNGILPMMLRILEDVITKNSNKKENDRAKEMDKTESENLLKFVFGVAFSVTAFFHCLLMQGRTADKLREFTDQFKLYSECLKGGLLRECIELMIRIRPRDEQAVVLVKKLIETIGKLINGMKKVRSEVLHSGACPRARHKWCRARVAAGMHHHHDILGEATSRLPVPSACCLALLYGTLTSLLAHDELAAHAPLRNKTLRVMLNCGVCCCFSAGTLMESIVRVMLTHSGAAPLCLQVLEHTVYGELGASVLAPRLTDQLPCAVCEPTDDRRDSNRRFCQLAAGPVERKSVWSFLIHYNSLLQLDNHNSVLHATVAHLLRVTPKCRMEMKYELLFSVIYPTFIVAKHRYIIRMEESAYFLTVSCLNIFASLLNTVAFAEQFIQKGGLSYVLELVSLPEFSNQCCSILEIAIIVEIFKLMKENSEMAYYREMNSLSSVQMLFKSLSDVTDKYFKICKTKLPIEKYEELIDVSKERGSLAFVPSMESVDKKMSAPQPIKCNNFVSPNNCVDDLRSNEVDVLKSVCTFWKTCAGLCLYSPMFREYVAGEPAVLDSYALLKLVLHCLCSTEATPDESRILLKIFEALLTVQLAVADVTSGRSKETSCNLVREALVSEAASLESSGRLRALCEALVRVATAEPSAYHAMPRLTHAKVPPLVCASSSSSGECSSSEESAPALYASEHSDNATNRPDDGYEADVEIAKFDLLPSYKSRKLSNMTSIPAAGLHNVLPDTLTMECGEYTKNGELAHPELCIIVVDILTKLIDKVMKERASGSANGRSVSAASRLVRACVSRLQAPRPPPPPALLHRLLAPPTQHLLACDDAQLQELINGVVELVVCVGRCSVDAAEVAALLRCAATQPAPALLGALHRLLPAHPHTPDHLLTFPITVQPTDSMQYLADDFVHVTANGVSSQSPAAEAAAKKLREAHLKSGIVSCWSAGAWHAGVGGGWGGPWLAGFAVTLWIGTDAEPHTHNENSTDIKCDSSDSEGVKGDTKPPDKAANKTERTELSHVVSIGHESLMFELWIETHTGSLVVRLSRPDVSGSRVVSAARCSSALTARFTCLALNVAERLHRRQLHMQVTIFVNGYEFETLSLPVQGVVLRKSNVTHVLLGQCVRPGVAGVAGAADAGVFHVSALSVYRSPALTAPLALHIAAHGPDSDCQVKCHTPNYTALLTPEVLDSGIDWDQVFDMSESTLRAFHDNLLLKFSAHAPALINLYHTTTQPAFPGLVGMGGGGGVGAAGASIPEALGVWWSAAPLASTHHGLAPALLARGGIDLLLYLYARVVELNAGPVEQAMALKILLRARNLDARLHAGFTETSFDMLLAVMAAPTAAITPHLLKVILDECCSSVVLRVGGSACVWWRCEAALRDPALLQLLARAAATLDDTQEYEWEVEGGGSGGGRATERGSVWSLALTCIAALLRDDHPRRTFNHYQMHRKDVMNHILIACKERVLNGNGSGWRGGWARVVGVVRALLAHPPTLHHTAALADFLLLMHQASDTFVTHSRANFYFLLTSETREMSGFDTVSRRKSTRRSVRSGTEDATDHTPEEDSDRIDSSLDSTKQMKGIINMHIREGRKHNLSSTSEASDTTNELCEGSESSGGGGEERAPLTEYVVVEKEELHHTTVEMYSSGIYHQSKVRAGAGAGWAACEGLLLLLRDALQHLPDTAVQNLPQGVCSVVVCECVCALGNHPGAGVRARVLRLARALLARAPHDTARRLANTHYTTHLANQISLYEGSWELAEACAELITDCELPLQDQLDEEVWSNVTATGLSQSAPLLALLPVTLHDVPLAHNVARLIARLVDKASLKLISEVCLVEVVVRTIRAVGEMAADAEGRDLLLDDLTELLTKVAVKALAAQHNTQTIIEMHHMLTYVEWEGGEGAAQAARATQGALYIAQIEWLERAHHSDTTRPTNYFATVLSSAVSRGGAGAESAVRLGGVAARAVAHLTRSSTPAAADLALVRRLLGAVESRRVWAGAEGAAALSALVGWALARRGAVGVAALRALYRAPGSALRPLAPDPPAARRLAVYLLVTLQEVHAEAERGPPPLELPITDWARGWALALQAGLPDRLHSDSLTLEAESYLRADEERWARAAARLRPAVAKVVFGKESLASRVAETAMAATRVAVEAQNAERKRFMEHLRVADARAAAAGLAWQRLIQTHTHEQGVWHDPRSYPQSWQLDPTEGPGRVRVRLRRAHLHVPPRFLKPQYRYKAESGHRSAPLSSVVGSGLAGRGGLVARLQLNETVTYMARVTCVTVASETRGELLLSDRSVHFVPDDAPPEPPTPPTGSTWRRRERLPPPPREPAHSWPLHTLLQVVTRRWCLQEVAVELFLNSGHAHLIAFDDVAERGSFLKALAACHLPAKIEPDSLSEAMSAWRAGSITNWEYLMRLNGLAGRSYNDLMQYPVLPFVLADYTSRILDLEDPAVFRDLSRPMAVQNKAREQHYISIYNDLKAARREGCSPLLSRQPHHYASLYSNSGGVLHYLVRLPPFTELFLNYQDNNFDMPDRTFHSLATTWRLITNDSPTDVKELIPELFYLPELFHNNEGLNLGVRQCGAGVDSVELPPWAADARLFTLIHRQALESRAVTERLPAWIDLVFGYKQTGQAAIDALNVFPACTYYGFDPLSLEDEVDRTAAAAMVRTYGQAPRQLLRTPHPQPAASLRSAGVAPPVWSGVRAARWGTYCGSPALPAPAPAARRPLPAAHHLRPLPAPRAALAAPHTAALLPLHEDAEGPASGTTSYGLLSWGHSDDIVRLKRRRDGAPDLLLHIPTIDRITVVWTSVTGGSGGWPCMVGHASGRVLALSVRVCGSALRTRTRLLLAHCAPISALYACASAALLLSASLDGNIVLWDLNQLTYIRSLPNRDMSPVTHGTISPTLCDVATVHDVTQGAARPDLPPNDDDEGAAFEYEKDAPHKYKSLIRVHTVNGTFVGSVKVSEVVTCLCYSGAAEGVSVNSLAVGLRSGAVRFYSSWDLRPTLTLQPCARAPLTSITYSSDSMLLFGCYEGGVVVAWESNETGRSAPIRLHPAHALI